MTDKTKILSNEEMDALLKATEEKTQDLTELVGSAANNIRHERTLNHKALSNITELTWSECEKNLSSFLRKKINIKSKSTHLVQLVDALHGKAEKHVFTVFKVLPHNMYAVIVMNMDLLHQALHFMFGGQGNDHSPVIEIPGKIGQIVAEHICVHVMESFAQACKEYGVVTHETVKTVTLPNLITKLGMEDSIYSIELGVYFGDKETSLSIIIAADFLHAFIPANEDTTHSDKGSWRAAIETQVIDSNVTVCASLSEITMKASELVALKNGDLIPIGDPTAVFLCLNNTKLFSGIAAQANSNRVVKILHEI